MGRHWRTCLNLEFKSTSYSGEVFPVKIHVFTCPESVRRKLGPKDGESPHMDLEFSLGLLEVDPKGTGSTPYVSRNLL